LEISLIKGIGERFSLVHIDKSIIYETSPYDLSAEELDGEGALLYDKEKQFFIFHTSFNKVISFF
jgi:hypothetical protein